MTQPSTPYPAWAFSREDESDDRRFYTEPRLVVHVDEHAVRAITAYYARVLPQGGALLDLMSSWRSHLPDSFPKKRLLGLGMNADEMAENPLLDEFVVQDLNRQPALPFPDASFEAAIVTVSVQYLTQPLDVFREVNRVLVPGGTFHVVFSNRCFPTKAVALWHALDDAGHAQLVASYFQRSGGWEPAAFEDLSPRIEPYSDPVYVVRAANLS